MVITPGIDANSPTDLLIEELIRRGASDELITQAKEILANNESRARIENAMNTSARSEKIKDLPSEINKLTERITDLRYHINQSSKTLGYNLFSDNSETVRISHSIGKPVTNFSDLHIFVDDIHKFIIQSANWGKLYSHEKINPCLEIINLYRNNFDHIFDMRGKGDGADKMYKRLGEINLTLLGHKAVKMDECPILQIQILRQVSEMLSILDANIESWLSSI